MQRNNEWKTKAAGILGALKAAFVRAGTNLAHFIKTRVIPAIRTLAITASVSLARALGWITEALHSWAPKAYTPKARTTRK